MNTITIDGKTIELSKETTDELKKKLFSEFPKDDDMFYMIDEYGDINCSAWEDDCDTDKEIMEIGNIYETMEEAQRHVKWLKAVQRVKEYIKKEFGEFVPDWDNAQQSKYAVKQYSFYNKVFTETFYFKHKIYSPIGYLETQKNIDQLIKDNEADLKIIFNVE